MSITETQYIDEVLRTCAEDSPEERLLLGAMGLTGEAGEVIDLVKKYRYQGHSLPDAAKIKDELGDVLWYLTLLCHTFGFTLEDIRTANVVKMRLRYPDGFDAQRSLNRHEYEQIGGSNATH